MIMLFSGAVLYNHLSSISYHLRGLGLSILRYDCEYVSSNIFFCCSVNVITVCFNSSGLLYIFFPEKSSAMVFILNVSFLISMAARYQIFSVFTSEGFFFLAVM